MDVADAGDVERARAGDADAFRVLVERHSHSLFRLAYRLTGNEQDAEDVVQEAFLKSYRRLDQFESRANFGSWLYRIAANCSVDVLRARVRRDERPFAHGTEDEEELAPLAATGTTKAINVLTNFGALVPLLVRGHTHWPLALGMAGANVLGGTLGSHAAIHRGAGLVRLVAAFVSVAASIYLLVR